MTAVEFLMNKLKFIDKNAYNELYEHYEQSKEMEKEQKKQELIGLLNWMNKVGETNPMAFETDADDIVEMYLKGYYNGK